MQGKWNSWKLVLLAGAGLAVSTLGFGFASPLQGQDPSQTGAGARQNPAAPPQSFEVASIKPSAADARVIRIQTSPGGRYTASGVTAKMLIQQAFDVKDYQISGGPSWMSTERYDIVAKAETPDIDRELMRVLLQSLLAERFNLKIHRETKELPTYELLVAKNGPKLKKSEFQPEPKPGSPTAVSPKPGDPGGPPIVKPAGDGSAASGSGTPVVMKPGVAGGSKDVEVAGSPAKRGSVMSMGRGQLNAEGAPLSLLVQRLAQALGRPVIDKTGLAGNFDYSLQWTPDESERGVGIAGVEKPDAGLPAGDASGPSIFTALQEQLGLRLESQKGPVEILLIDRIDRPSGN